MGIRGKSNLTYYIIRSNFYLVGINGRGKSGYYCKVYNVYYALTEHALKSKLHINNYRNFPDSGRL